MKTKLKIHPLAETYPPMTAAEMEALTADIAEHGLQRDITLYEGQILDGRNRYLACEKAKVEPRFVEYEGDDPLGQVNSLNLTRDLTGAQRAIVAARQWLLNGDTKNKGGRPGKDKPLQSVTVSVRDLSRQFRTSNSSITQARDLLTDAPDLAAQVEARACSLAEAYGQFEDRQKQVKQKAKDAERIAEYTDAISNGETTLEKALQEIMDREREAREKATHDAQARQLFLNGLTEMVKWVEEWIGKRSDEHLAWYTEPGSPGIDHVLTAKRIASAIAHLERVKTITLEERTEHVQSRGAKARS